MEVTDALRVPLDPAHVREALGDLALLRASLDNCESFARLPGGEYALTMIVPLGALRARYEIRAHTAGRTRQAAHPEGEADAASPAGASSPPPPTTTPARSASRRAAKASGRCAGRSRSRSIRTRTANRRGSNTPSGRRFQVRSRACRRGRSKTRCAKWPTSSSPNSAKWCVRSTACRRFARSRKPASRRHVFLRPSTMSAAFSRRAVSIRRASFARLPPMPRAACCITGCRGTGSGRHDRDHSDDPHPLGLPGWAWATMLVCVALFAFFAQRVGYSRRLPSARPLEAPADMATSNARRLREWVPSTAIPKEPDHAPPRAARDRCTE